MWFKRRKRILEVFHERSEVSPAPIFQLATGYWASACCSPPTAWVCSPPSAPAKARGRLAQRLGLSSYPLDNFLNALVSLGFLERGDGGYRNSALSSTFLVEGKPAYMGEALNTATISTPSGAA